MRTSGKLRARMKNALLFEQRFNVGVRHGLALRRQGISHKKAWGRKEPQEAQAAQTRTFLCGLCLLWFLAVPHASCGPALFLRDAVMFVIQCGIVLPLFRDIVLRENSSHGACRFARAAVDAF